MPNMNSPLALQYLLNDIGGRRALALALRTREDGPGEMVSGKYVPNTRGLGGALARGMYGDPLDQLRQEEQGAVNSYGDELSGAMEGIVGSKSEMSDTDFAKRAARAQTAGVPQEIITRALKRRESWNMLNGILGSLDAPLPGVAGGGASPDAGVGGAPGGAVSAPPPRGAPPQQQGAAQAPQQGPVARAFAPTGGGTPLSNVPDGKLLTIGAMLDPDDPMAKLAAAEMKARAIKVGDQGIVYRENKAIGQLKDGYFHDLQTGQSYDMTGGMEAERAGAKAASEAKGRAPYTTVTTKQATANGGERDVTTFVSQLPGYGGGGGAGPQSPGPATPGSMQIPPQVQAVRDIDGAILKLQEGAPAADVMLSLQQMRRALTGGQDTKGGGPSPAPGGAAPLGTGQDSITAATAKQDVDSIGAGRKKLFEEQAGALGESLKQARAAQDVGLPMIAEVRRVLDDGKVKTGFGSNFGLGFGRMLSAAKLSNGEGVAATQTFMSASAKRVLALLQTGALGRTQISNADREFAEKAAAGSIKLDEASIRRILEIDERAQKSIIANHNQNVDRSKPFFQTPDQEAFYRVNAPPSIDPLVQKWLNQGGAASGDGR